MVGRRQITKKGKDKGGEEDSYEVYKDKETGEIILAINLMRQKKRTQRN